MKVVETIKNLSLFLKKLRLDHNDERLSDMAKKLGVSASYLSTVENEKKPMNDKLYESLIEKYQLNEDQKKELNLLRKLATQKVTVSLESMDESKRTQIIQFLSNIEDLSEEELEKVNLLIKKK